MCERDEATQICDAIAKRITQYYAVSASDSKPVVYEVLRLAAMMLSRQANEMEE